MDDRFKRRQPPTGTNRLSGTGKLNGQPEPAPQPGAKPRPLRAVPDPAPQDPAFMVRLDPNSGAGEFNFVIDSPQEVSRRVPQSGITAEASGGIPPQLHPAVSEVLGFIYELDQAFERKGKKR